MLAYVRTCVLACVLACVFLIKMRVIVMKGTLFLQGFLISMETN